MRVFYLILFVNILFFLMRKNCSDFCILSNKVSLILAQSERLRYT